MSHSHTLLQRGSMNASLSHGSMLRYEDNPFFANSSERISMELEILEAGSRAGHDLSGPHRQGYQQHRATARRSGNLAFIHPRQRYLHHPASYRHTSHRWEDSIYVPQAGTVVPHLPAHFPSGFSTSPIKYFNKPQPTTVRPCDIWPQLIVPEVEDVDMDDIFEAEDIASDSECDSDCDSDNTTVAPSLCDSESDCSASTTDVDDSSDDAEYIPTPRKTSPGSSRTPKGSRMRGDVSDRSLSPESPSETEIPYSTAPPGDVRRQLKGPDRRKSTAPQKTRSRTGKKKILSCLVAGCACRELMDERTRDRHMDSHFIQRYSCSACGTHFSTNYSHSRHSNLSKRCAGATLIVHHKAPYWRSCLRDLLCRPDEPRDPLLKRFFDNPNADTSCECGSHPLSASQRAARCRPPRGQ